MHAHTQNSNPWWWPWANMTSIPSDMTRTCTVKATIRKFSKLENEKFTSELWSRNFFLILSKNLRLPRDKLLVFSVHLKTIHVNSSHTQFTRLMESGYKQSFLLPCGLQKLHLVIFIFLFNRHNYHAHLNRTLQISITCECSVLAKNFKHINKL
jgi:hypothetical protein